MTEREFNTWLSQCLKDLSLQEQEVVLKKMDCWLQERQRHVNEEIGKSYIKCNKCGNYTPKSMCEVETQIEEVLHELFLQDGGFGGLDIYADITYRLELYVCPHCGGLIEKSRCMIEKKNERFKGEKV